ncbi:hypothetical protein DdX_01957 [Ditylenchus destructor]|uniref:Uncharacterized protein n=1 Tax=Ditylenchus destructor TaxID=166010 RepID=A0AAD4NGQ8_9BILA|nr:hypothetical protein DdX_01957 [Ditylenchus destructor]
MGFNHLSIHSYSSRRINIGRWTAVYVKVGAKELRHSLRRLPWAHAWMSTLCGALRIRAVCMTPAAVEWTITLQQKLRDGAEHYKGDFGKRIHSLAWNAYERGADLGICACKEAGHL